MTFYCSLWCQQNGGEIIGIIFFLIIVLFQFIKAVLDARGSKIEEEKKKKELQELLESESSPRPSGPRPSKKGGERKRLQRESTSDVSARNEMRSSRNVLSRELAPQGEGARFEAAPGTFDAAQVVASTIEPTVKPTLESMTGIYEAPPGGDEQGNSSLIPDIYKLLHHPDGMRQAVILAEILKRPGDPSSHR